VCHPRQPTRTAVTPQPGRLRSTSGRDILTKVVLPIETDDLTTWDEIQPTDAAVMRARGAIPVNYRDMAVAYPDLFPSGEAARKVFDRGNPGRMPIDKYLIGVYPRFSAVEYRRKRSRGPASTLLFDERRIDPLPWLTERIGGVSLQGPVRHGFSVSFKEYLKGRRITDTPQGYFTVDALRDRKFPDAATWEEVENHVYGLCFNEDVIAAGRIVWRQYVKKHQITGPASARRSP